MAGTGGLWTGPRRLARALVRHRAAVAWNLAFAALLVAGLELGLGWALDHPAPFAHSPAALNALRIIHDEERVRSIQYLPACAEYDPETTYRLRPGGCRFASTEFDTAYAVNSQGLRDDEASLSAPAVIVLGDSFAMGWGVAQDESFPQVLERTTGLRTLDAGIASFGTVRELRMLARLDRSALRALVIQYCDNDLRENREYAEAGNRLGIMSAESYAARCDKLAAQRYWFGRYANRLRKSVAHILGGKLKALAGLAGPAPRPTDDQEAALFLNALRHGPVDLAGLPVFVLELTSYAGSDGGFARALAARVAAGEAGGLDVRVLDTAGLFGPQDTYLLDDHLTAAGQAKVAALVAGAVRELPAR